MGSFSCPGCWESGGQWSGLLGGSLCCVCTWPSPGDLGAGGGSRPQAALHRWPCCRRGVGSWKTKVFSFYFHVSPLSVPKSKNGLIFLWAFRLSCLREFITSGLEVTLAVYLDDGIVVRCVPLVRVWFCSFCFGLSSCSYDVGVSLFHSCRLVMWLPDMPSDILWLCWATSRICSRVMMRLPPVEPYVKDTGQKLWN